MGKQSLMLIWHSPCHFADTRLGEVIQRLAVRGGGARREAEAIAAPRLATSHAGVGPLLRDLPTRTDTALRGGRRTFGLVLSRE